MNGKPSPGPGSYETNISSVVSKDMQKKMIMDKNSKRNLDGSPSNAGTATSTIYLNDSMQKLTKFKFNNISIPSIPSRFLTPVLKFDI